MSIERRKFPRRQLGGLAQIQSRDWTFPRDCRITDISEGGVRLHVEGIDVPPQFQLLFGGAVGRERECRVVWRLGFEVGAEFVDTKRHLLRRALR